MRTARNMAGPGYLTISAWGIKWRGERDGNAMTTKQYIELWACAQDVPREAIEHLGRGRACMARAKLAGGQYGEIWMDGQGRYYHCIREGK